MASAKRDGLYKREGSKFWWVRVDPITGKPKSTGCVDKEAAKTWRAARERDAADPANAKAKNATLAGWVSRYLAMKEREGAAAATIEMYELKLGHFLRVWGEGCKLIEVDEDKLDAYVARRRGEDVTDHTIFKEVAVLKRVLHAAKRSKEYTGDLSTLKPLDLHAGYKPRERVLSREEVAALLNELEGPTWALVAVCVALGCRRSEGARLDPADIDLERGFARIRGTKTDESDRAVPVLSLFRPMLERALPLLPFKAKTTNVNREVYWACRRAGIAHASFNDFRRTHATLLLEEGVDRDVVRRLLGHTTDKLVNTVYGRPKPEALAKLAEPKLLGAAPVLVQVRDSSAGVLTKLGDPSGNRTRVTGVRGRDRRLGWFGKKAKSQKTCRPERTDRAGRRWRRVAKDASTLQWLGRKTAALQVALGAGL